jgi:G3E family GTPase
VYEKNKTKLILVTGFLGSGKTTVMKNLIHHPDLSFDQRVGVIINEFGRINVDARLFEEPGLSITEINNGSIFCKCLEGTFIEHIVYLKEKKLDYLFVESSGLSDPSSMHSIMEHVTKISEGAFVYAGTICVVDAKYYLKISQSLMTLQRQIASAHMVLVNKTDLADDQTIEQVIRNIHQINPFARIEPTSYGQLPVPFFSFFDGTEDHSPDIPSLNTPLNRPDVLLLTSGFILSEQFIPSLLKAFEGKILRLKGFVRYPDGTHHIEVVANEHMDRRFDRIRENSELIVIPFPGISLCDEMTEYLAEYSDWTCEII